MSREESLANARIIVAATDLPVAADLEHGFGDNPDAAAETIRLAAEIGLVGGPSKTPGHIARNRFTTLRSRRSGWRRRCRRRGRCRFPFTLAARAENYVRGNPDLDDTIKRLVAYEQAGADVLLRRGCRIWRRCARSAPPCRSR